MPDMPIKRQTNRGELYPPVMPYSSGHLEVDDLHTLYWEQCGNPDGVPVVLLHGGPGDCITPAHRRFFDPDFYRIILFDQRGCGRSTPHAALERNTTQDLVEDIEKLRRKLGIEKWHIAGGSWGSTLALAYAQTHPDGCLGLILRSIFLMRRQEIDWMLYGTRRFFPDVWEAFAGHLPEDERADLLEGYYKRLTSGDIQVQSSAAKVWNNYESTCATLIPQGERVYATEEDVSHAVCIARMETHYFRNNMFTPETQLLDNVDRIRHIPGVIVHGRYDMLCPVQTAYELHQRWPEARLIVVPDAGHSAMEPTLRAELIMAGERMKDISP